MSEREILCLSQTEKKTLFHFLSILYEDIWIEASYDPYCKETEKLCKEKLLPTIKKINELLEFKK